MASQWFRRQAESSFRAVMVRLEYDAQYLSASVEKVQMTDGIMKTQWKDNIYRIILRLNDNYPMAKVKYRFVGAR